MKLGSARECQSGQGRWMMKSKRCLSRSLLSLSFLNKPEKKTMSSAWASSQSSWILITSKSKYLKGLQIHCFLPRMKPEMNSGRSSHGFRLNRAIYMSKSSRYRGNSISIRPRPKSKKWNLRSFDSKLK